MKRPGIIGWIALAMIGFLGTVQAEPLEVGIGAAPTFHTTPSYEAFSEDNLVMGRFAATVRAEVASLAGFKLLPFVSYHVGIDRGAPYQRLFLTKLSAQDFCAGLRVRKGLLSFLGAYIEAAAGALNAKMSASREYDYESAPNAEDWTDSKWTWTAGGVLGLEVYLSKAWLRSRGVKRFNFGGDIGFGYYQRGTVKIEPKLSNPPDNAIPVIPPSWGDLHLSGFTLEIGAAVRFF